MRTTNPTAVAAPSHTAKRETGRAGVSRAGGGAPVRTGPAVVVVVKRFLGGRCRREWTRQKIAAGRPRANASQGKVPGRCTAPRSRSRGLRWLGLPPLLVRRSSWPEPCTNRRVTPASVPSNRSHSRGVRCSGRDVPACTRAALAHFGYQPALDGIRAFAVAAVLFYHAGQSWAVGGFLGVDTFFVLSGFLITTLLVTEWTNRGGINLLAFWVRRARRLLPALFLVMVGIVDLRGRVRGAGRAGAHPGRLVRVARVRGQLALHLLRPVVLRPVLAAVAAAPHVVAGDRGAVLPGVAAGRGRAAVVATFAARLARRRAW